MPPAEGPVRGWNPLSQSFYNAADPYGVGIAAPGNPIFGSQYGPNQMLDLEDLNLPGLTPSDRQYLAGLARYYNPQSAEALANANAWNAPAAAAAPPVVAPAPVAAAPAWPAGWDPAANERARQMAGGEGGGGLGFSGANPALATGYAAPQNYNPQNAAATWGQTENWTPPPQGLSPWGAPPPQPAQQNPLPAGAPSRARFLRESGIGPRPMAPNLPPQPPGFGTPYEQLERARNPQAYAAWENAAGQRQAQDAAVNEWKTGRDRYLPDYRNQLKTWLGQNAPNWQPTTPAPTPPPQNLSGAAWGQANPYSVPNTRPPSAYDVFGRSA